MPYSLGQFGVGNIDLYNRPIVRNDDGSYSTVRSISFNDGLNEILIPTVSDDGRIMTDDEAIKNFYTTGKYLGVFKTPEEANQYAQQLHNQQLNFYNPIANNNSRMPGDYAELMGRIRRQQGL